MKPILLVYPIILFLAVQRVKSGITIDAATCDESTILNALAEAADMSDYAFSQLEAISNQKLSSDEERVVFNTVYSFFGSEKIHQMEDSVLLLRSKSLFKIYLYY